MEYVDPIEVRCHPSCDGSLALESFPEDEDQGDDYGHAGYRFPGGEEERLPVESAEERIEGLRGLQKAIELLFQAFCDVRIGKRWQSELQQIRRWLRPRATKKKKTRKS